MSWTVNFQEPLVHKTTSSMFKSKVSLKRSKFLPSDQMSMSIEGKMKPQVLAIQGKMKPSVTPRVVKLCQARETVSSELAQNPALSPEEACKKLYGNRTETGNKLYEDEITPASDEDLQQALSCGRWGPTQPGELFLRVYHDVLTCLEADPLGGMVSPPLLGSYGTIPLTIIAPLVDVARHMSNVIVRAKTEVFFATCSWSPSKAVTLVTDALKELSKRAGERNERVAVRIMCDAGTPSHRAAQFMKRHQKLAPDVYSGKKMQLPHPKEVPHLDMEVASLHKPLLGTLHAKFMVVDRQIGIVGSNNMEDNANLEMMTHLEGPIVDSLYDTALITWNEAFNPPLPSYYTPAHEGGLGTTSQPPSSSVFPPADTPQYPTSVDTREQQTIVQDGTDASQLPAHGPGDPHYDDTIAAEITRVQSMYSPKDGESRLSAINRHLNYTIKSDAEPTGPELGAGDEFTPYIAHANSAFPMAMVSRRPYGPLSNIDAFVPQNEAFLSCIRNAKSSIFIQTPNLNATPLIPAIVAAVKRGVDVTCYVCLGYNDPGQMMPGQGGINETFAGKICKELSPDERSRFNYHWYTGKDQSKPIHHSFKQRACHIKFLIADDRVGIQGSGNQDTQSWYHSQEINVMVDSEEICQKWREGLERNQNTAKFGKGRQEDGIWVDENGKEAVGSTGTWNPPMSWIMATIGMVKKVQEKGGF